MSFKVATLPGMEHSAIPLRTYSHYWISRFDFFTTVAKYRGWSSSSRFVYPGFESRSSWMVVFGFVLPRHCRLINNKELNVMIMKLKHKPEIMCMLHTPQRNAWEKVQVVAKFICRCLFSRTCDGFIYCALHFHLIGYGRIYYGWALFCSPWDCLFYLFIYLICNKRKTLQLLICI